MDQEEDCLLDTILEIKADLLFDWYTCFDNNNNQHEQVKQEIRNTMSSEDSQRDHRVNFIMRLMSEEPHGYKDRSGICRKRVDLALLILHVMKESEYWCEFLQNTRAASEEVDLENAPLIRRALSSCRTGLDQIKEKYRQQDASLSLCEAAKLEDVEQVRTLIGGGERIKTDDKHRYTPLHYAAMAINPNVEIAKMLVEVMRQEDCLDMINKSCNKHYGWNTALHIAAGNANVTQEFIEQFRAADPTLINYVYDTPFHVAAKSKNPKAIVYMLNTFAPTHNRWDVDDVDDCQDPTTRNTVINICARSGNSEAVALLIQHGADISKGVLHEIVDECIRSPQKIDKLKEVYQVIVDNAVTWRCLEQEEVNPLKGSGEYVKKLKETLIWLITRPLQEYNHEDVQQYAISRGAVTMLQEIVHTEDVFRTVTEFIEEFDVTNFTQETMVRDDAKRCGTRKKNNEDTATYLCSGNTESEDMESRRRPKRKFDESHTPTIPYLAYMLNCFDRWKATNILSTKLLKQLTKPYFVIIQRVYFLVGMLQLLFMILFSVYYTPDICSLSMMFAMNNTVCSSSNYYKQFSLDAYDNNTKTSTTVIQQRSSLSWLWLIWPIILVTSNLVGAFFTVEYTRVTFKGRVSYNESINFMYTSFASHLCNVLLWPILPKIFCLTVFVWFFKYCNSETHESYVEVTAMVLLFGWITDLRFFGAVNKNFSVSTLMIKEIIAKDIPSFMLFFIFTVVGFSFAMHALRVSSCDVNEYIYLWETFSGVLSSGFGIGDFFENTISSSSCVGARTHHLLEAVYFSYIVVTLIILLNLLIAMMNNRYEIAKQRAENIWRYQILCKRGALQSHKIIANIVKKCRIPFTPTKNRKFLLCCFCCCFYDKNPHKITKDDVGDGRKRYYLKVRLNADEH